MGPKTALPTRIVCPHVAEGCGGCALMQLTYADQQRTKGLAVQHAADTYPRLALEVAPIVAPPTIDAYRTRAKLMVSSQRVGLYRDGTHELVDIPECRVLSPPLRATAMAVRRVLEQHSAFASRVRAVDLREAVDPDTTSVRVLVTWVVARSKTSSRESDDLDAPSRALAASSPHPVFIAYSERDEDAVQALGDTPIALGEATRLRDAGPHAWTFASHGSFVQAHRGVAHLIFSRIERSMPRATDGHPVTVLDLYSGAGPIALSLAARGAKVHMIESYAPAARAALDAAQEQSLTLTADARTTELGLEACAARAQHFDVIVCNPPRRGVSREARVGIAKLQPKKILYVSCNPTTLLRDLEHFASLGYRAATLEPYDMIPLTDHVEVFAELVAAPPQAPARLRVGTQTEDAIVVDARAHDASHGATSGFVRPLRGADDATGATLLLRAGVEVRGDISTTWIAVVSGITHRKGKLRSPKGPVATYRRERVVRGASVLAITTTTRRIDILRRALRSIGHPIVGDDRFGDPRTNTYYLERRGLDCAFLHCKELSWGDLHAEAELPGLFQAVLASPDAHP